MGEHPVLENDDRADYLQCEYFVDPETNGIGSAALEDHGWPWWKSTASLEPRTTPAKFLPFPATIPKSEPRTAPAKYEPYALTHAEVLAKRRTEIERVQPAFERAWRAWQDPSPRNLWWRKYYHIFWTPLGTGGNDA